MERKHYIKEKIVMTPERVEKLKQALFVQGTEARDDFCGVPTMNMDKDAVENLMEQVIDQMPEEEFERFYEKYVKKEDPMDSVSIYSMNDLIDTYKRMGEDSKYTVLMYMSELTGKSVDFLLEKVEP